MQRIFSLLLASVLLLPACTSHKKLTYLNNLDTASVQQFFEAERPDYHIQTRDILYINIITLDPEINELLNPGTRQFSSLFSNDPNRYIHGYTVNDSGYISLPILGSLYISGHTVDEITGIIYKKAKEYLKDPIVNVRLLSFKFTVIGEVKSPGTYTNFNNQLTVLEAIGMAGDITDYGNRSKVLVVRPTKTGTSTYRINVQDKNLLTSEGYFLLPNDLVIVEPIKSKTFRLNMPTMTLFLATISTLILVLNFIQ